ncbi:MAG: LicD family protein [Oscillospiraceae bacterium]|nr:LicD family protein [Oscillospiraceae bacterium]
MKEIPVEELRPIQLGIMDELDAFCRSHDISYMLIGGTLIGAIRHKGYIPWDDDIDIGLLRPDYDRLLVEFQSASGHVKLLKPEQSPNYHFAFCKAIDTRTILIESDKKHALGVNVDVFPLDSMPDTMEECREHLRHLKRYHNQLIVKYMHLRKGRSPLKNGLILLSRLPLRLIPDRFLLHRITGLMMQYEKNRSSKYVANLCGAWGEKEIYTRSDFLHPIDAEFEGRQYRIPDCYDHVLRGVYGDYMQLPPESQRITHHAFKAFWNPKNSFFD